LYPEPSVRFGLSYSLAQNPGSFVNVLYFCSASLVISVTVPQSFSVKAGVKLLDFWEVRLIVNMVRA
jgi:hypothetical protein